MLPEAGSYDELRRRFVWEVPDRFHIATAVCDRWADAEPDREAIVFASEDGGATRHSYGELKRRSNRLANVFADRGVARGDRIGVLLPQMPQTAIAHIAALKLGAISIPLFTLFGVEALKFRLADSGAKAVVTDATGAEKIAAIRDRLPALEIVLCVEGAVGGATDFETALAGGAEEFQVVDTAADDPAFIIYTSGTTGQPKGALHAHRVLLGHLPGVEMSHDFLPAPGDRFWTPADWAWIGGLLDVLMPSLFHGIPVVACRFRKFTGEAAFRLMAEHKVRNAFLPPTALKLMRQVENPRERFDYSLRSVASGGETLGAELIDWGRRTFGLTINEFYGQTECNMIVSSCAAIMDARPGIMGRPVPGHAVDVVDAAGNPVANGQPGNIAVKRPDPVMFLGYWGNETATEAKFVGDWMLTGDTGIRDENGWIRFVGRDDDVITSSGYRIGPGEIEDCLIRHQAVALAVVVGKPDKQRTEIVKAYIVLKPGFERTDALAAEIAAHVRERLAAHEYPREIAFVDELPMTTTGKIVRRELRARAIAELREAGDG